MLFLLVGCLATESTLIGKEDGGECPPVDWYLDADGDGFGGDEVLSACEPPGEGWESDSSDCDDLDGSVFPGADEWCNLVDDDCDGLVDDDPVDASTWYADLDGDTYGDPASPAVACDQPAGTVVDATDCDDAFADTNPAGIEVCDGRDNDCNSLVDDDPVDPSTWYQDADTDTHGNPEVWLTACEQPEGYVALADDCDDEDVATWETCANDPVAHSAVCTGGYPLYTYEVSDPTNPELHLMGVYEPTASRILVELDRDADVVLVLSSYSSVSWEVTATSRTRLSEVVVNSYEPSTVTAPHGVPTTTTWYRAYAYGWPYVSGGSDTPALVAAIEADFGVALTSFTGCYQADGFRLE